MKGDIIIVEDHHKHAAEAIVEAVISEIRNISMCYTIAISGESGSGKSEMAKAIADALKSRKINAATLGQDDYFYLPPKSNDARRREESDWLGPHVEVDLRTLQVNINDARSGKKQITKPVVFYNEDKIGEEIVDLSGIQTVIAEGTYTSLLKNIDTKIFITANRLDTMQHRIKRNRGNEVGDPFIEEVLKTEHKIIAGHRLLADIILTKDFEVIFQD